MKKSFHFVKHILKYFLFYRFWPLLIVISLLLTCSDVPPSPPLQNQVDFLLREFISRKWVGTNEIPTNLFADSGMKQTACFSFSDVDNTNMTQYEWKSSIYSNNNDPQDVWFLTKEDENGNLVLDSVDLKLNGETAYYFLLRYNNADDHLTFQSTNKSNNKSYSVSYPLGSVSRSATNDQGETSFNGYSIYIPVLMRNVNTNSSPISIEFNFPIIFEISRADEISNLKKYYEKLKTKINYNLVKSYWNTYYEVDNIESGVHGCAQ